MDASPDSTDRVAIVRESGTAYPETPPFHPSEPYPEYPFGGHVGSEPNPAYRLVRRALRDLGLDAKRFGTAHWNPLGELVSPGASVVIKPNLVLDVHPRGGDLQCLITHGSIVRAILDYVYLALGGKGSVIVGDAPLQGTDFDRAVRMAGLPGVIAFLRAETKLPVACMDFRQVVARMDARFHVQEWIEVPGDPAGYAVFDLGGDSVLEPIARDSRRFRVANYRAEDTLQYHHENCHKYVVARSVLDADVVINVPKLKTHCKAGVTLGLKNFVGIVGRKQCLAHHRYGGTIQGGDEYPDSSLLKRISVDLERRIDGEPSPSKRRALSLVYRVNERLIKTLGVDPYRDGGWHGNDTVWRMVLDLVRIARYGTVAGELAGEPQRRWLTLIDGIIAGEQEGPLEAASLPAGCVVAGYSPAETDAATSTFMGFDYEKIPLVKHAMLLERWPLTARAPLALRVRINGVSRTLPELKHAPECMRFTPAAGWVGHIELAGAHPPLLVGSQG